MEHIKKSGEAGVEMCKILGIDNKYVSSVTIQLEANEIAVVLVKFILTKEQWSQIGQPKP